MAKSIWKVGGGNGKCVVYMTFDNEAFQYVVDPSKSNKDENLTVGGQAGSYPARLCVDINTALKAAQTFAEHGVMETSIVWERDGVVELV